MCQSTLFVWTLTLLDTSFLQLLPLFCWPTPQSVGVFFLNFVAWSQFSELLNSHSVLSISIILSTLMDSAIIPSHSQIYRPVPFYLHLSPKCQDHVSSSSFTHTCLSDSACVCWTICLPKHVPCSVTWIIPLFSHSCPNFQSFFHTFPCNQCPDPWILWFFLFFPESLVWSLFSHASIAPLSKCLLGS